MPWPKKRKTLRRLRELAFLKMSGLQTVLMSEICRGLPLSEQREAKILCTMAQARLIRWDEVEKVWLPFDSPTEQHYLRWLKKSRKRRRDLMVQRFGPSVLKAPIRRKTSALPAWFQT